MTPEELMSVLNITHPAVSQTVFVAPAIRRNSEAEAYLIGLGIACIIFGVLFLVSVCYNRIHPPQRSINNSPI
jgi:hypothetical protein